MPKENRYYRGAGYHVNHDVAEAFAESYLSEDGKLINIDSDSFESDLQHFLESHCMVENAFRTVNTDKLFTELREDAGVF